jgi:hypothetical protein
MGNSAMSRIAEETLKTITRLLPNRFEMWKKPFRIPQTDKQAPIVAGWKPRSPREMEIA